MKRVKGVIQIIHGMSEYKGRYSDFINFFKNNGYFVCIKNHPHHGKEALIENNLGIFNNDFNLVIKNQILMSQSLKRKYPNLPLYIFSHSMGSFIAQEHMKFSANIIDGYIISGSSFKNTFSWKFAKYFSIILDKIYKNKIPYFFHKLIFFKYNSLYKNKKNIVNTWLTRDIYSVISYNKNTLTGFSYSSNFYKEFFYFLNNLYKKKTFLNVPKNKSILVIGGARDPVGNFSKSLIKLKKFYENLNFNSVDLKIFKKCRHELHNEINKTEVFYFIKNWLEKG